MVDFTRLTRAEIQQLLGDNPKLVRAYEGLQRAMLEALPADIATAQTTAEQGVTDAAAAQATADAAVPQTTQVISGGGLTGGGDLSTDRTLAVGAGTGIAVNADDVAIDTTSEAERIRDVIGTALVAGSNVTITVNDAGDTITIAASSGASSWALAGTGQTATGVYDFAVDGAKANIDFVGLSSFNELLIIARNLTDGTTGVRELLVSTDNGSTFYNASGDYVKIDANGLETAQTVLAFHNTNSTAARSLVVHILNTKGAAKYATVGENLLPALFVASASDINAVRVNSSGGGNITGGTVRVYAR